MDLLSQMLADETQPGDAGMGGFRHRPLHVEVKHRFGTAGAFLGQPPYLSPIAFERQYAATALEPGAHEHAVVLAPVKERPGNVAASCTASVPAVRDSHSTRRRWQHAGRTSTCSRWRAVEV